MIFHRPTLFRTQVPNSAGSNIALTLGTAEGEVFSYTNGNMKLTTKRLLGSGSKWARLKIVSMCINDRSDIYIGPLSAGSTPQIARVGAFFRINFFEIDKI